MNLPANAGEVSTMPRSGTCPGGENGNTLQYSCLENRADKSLTGYSPRGRRGLSTASMIWLQEQIFLEGLNVFIGK